MAIGELFSNVLMWGLWMRGSALDWMVPGYTGLLFLYLMYRGGAWRLGMKGSIKVRFVCYEALRYISRQSIGYQVSIYLKKMRVECEHVLMVI